MVQLMMVQLMIDGKNNNSTLVVTWVVIRGTRVYTIICNINTCNILCLTGLLHLHRSSGALHFFFTLLVTCYLLLPALLPLFLVFFPSLFLPLPLPLLLELLLLLSFLLFDTLPLLPLPLPTLDETRARIN